MVVRLSHFAGTRQYTGLSCSVLSTIQAALLAHSGCSSAAACLQAARLAMPAAADALPVLSPSLVSPPITTTLPPGRASAARSPRGLSMGARAVLQQRHDVNSIITNRECAPTRGMFLAVRNWPCVLCASCAACGHTAWQSCLLHSTGVGTAGPAANATARMLRWPAVAHESGVVLLSAVPYHWGLSAVTSMVSTDAVKLPSASTPPITIKVLQQWTQIVSGVRSVTHTHQ